jgi:hypothetical protein
MFDKPAHDSRSIHHGVSLATKEGNWDGCSQMSPSSTASMIAHGEQTIAHHCTAVAKIIWRAVVIGNGGPLQGNCHHTKSCSNWCDGASCTPQPEIDTMGACSCWESCCTGEHSLSQYPPAELAK